MKKHLVKKILITYTTKQFLLQVLLALECIRSIDYLNKTLCLNIKIIILLRSKNKKTLKTLNVNIDYINGVLLITFKKKKLII